MGRKLSKVIGQTIIATFDYINEGFIFIIASFVFINATCVYKNKACNYIIEACIYSLPLIKCNFAISAKQVYL